MNNYHRTRPRNLARRSSSSNLFEDLFGCGCSLLLLLVLGVFGVLALDDLVLRLVGPVRDDQWQAIPWILRAIVAFMLGSIIVPAWLIVFVISLAVGTPIFALLLF